MQQTQHGSCLLIEDEAKGFKRVFEPAFVR